MVERMDETCIFDDPAVREIVESISGWFISQQALGILTQLASVSLLQEFRISR